MKVSFWTSVIILIVGLYDLAFAINKQRQTKKISWAFYGLGVLFTVSGFVLMLQNWIR